LAQQNDQHSQGLPDKEPLIEAVVSCRQDPDGSRSLHFHAQVIEVLGALMRSPLAGTDDAIVHALEQIGRFCGFDRAQVFRLWLAPGTAPIDVTHAWSEPGFKPAFSQGQALPRDILTAWRRQMDADDCVVLPQIAALPDGSPGKGQLQQQGVLSLLVVPMRAEGRFSGFISFDCLRHHRTFPPDEVHLLRSVADAIGALLTRADTAAEIARSQASLAEANQRLMSTLRALPDLILEVDAGGRYLDVHTSDPGQMMLPAEELIGRTDEEALTPEIAALNRRAMAEVDATGRSGPHPFWARTPRGLRRYVLTASRRPPLTPGEAPGYVFVARDVTDEWTLQREAERLSLVARRMNDMVIVTDVTSRIEWVNPAFEARSGWRLDEIRGRTAREVLNPPGTTPAAVERIGRELSQGRAVRTELFSLSRYGEGFWIDVDCQPLHDRTGELIGFVSIATDITQHKTHAAALERLAREANEARARLEMAVEALPDAFVYFDADNKLVLCNERYRTLCPGEVPGLCFDEFPPNPDSDGEMSDERQVADGRWFRMIERRTPEGGRVGMCIDITEVKEAERRLVDIIQGAEVGTWEWNLPSGINIINARWAEIVGYRLEDLAPFDINVWRELVHPADLAHAESKLAQVHARETDHFEYHLRMRHRAGHWVRVLSRGRVARWAPDGSPEMMAGVHIDITALKQAEERLAQIIDAAMAGTWEFRAPDGRIQINDYWANMLGYNREELEGLPGHGFRGLVHPEDLARLDQLHEQRLARGETYFSHEMRMRHKDGHWVWILSRGQVMERGTDGQPVREGGIHLDISERKMLESQLTAERDYLTRLMETSASGIAALDAQGRFIYVNREAEEILGLNAAAIEGRTHDSPEWQMSALDGSPFAHAGMIAQRVVQQREIVRDVRFSISWPDGTRRMLSINAAPISAEGLAVRVVCSINDITEQIAAETELRKAAERAEAANQAKSRFLANMSHEIRTPLNGVLGMAQVLEDELTEPRHRHILGIIRESGEMLLGVLNDVLDMSKIEAGKLTLEDVAFDPTGLASRIEAMHQPNATAKGLRFDLHLTPAARGMRMGDPSRLSQVLHNLIGNAVKFTESGGVTVTMDAPGGDRLDVTVRDTGIGMTEAQLARVFEDFEQADGTVTRRFGGTGLGMSIVRRLVDLMGGEIAITSTPGAGTEVRLHLPLPRASAPAACPAGPAAGARSLAGLRVLVADDNHTNRLILHTMLTRLGIETVMVADGRAAVETWEPGRFDVLLLDISMPVLDGMSALAELRTLEAAAGVPPAPALAITANALSHQVAEYAQAGFAAHLGKPFRREDLEAALAAVTQPGR